VVELPRLAPVKFLPGKDSLFFLMLEDGDKKTVYNAKAEKLFTIAAEKIEFNNEGYFTYNQKQKRGLLSLNGKIILKPEFDAIGAVLQNQVATLKDKKFGFIDLARKKEIKPEYEKNILTYNQQRLIAVKNGLSAIIGWDNKPLTGFEFEEVNYWNDSTALVKKNFQWILYNFIDKRIVADKIKAFKWVLNSPKEKIMIIQQENKYGVISNTRGAVIPATFSDIVNVGSATQPVYFTEKHVEEASIFVVIYYDKEGVQLRKYVYEGGDYEKIYCSGK
ncbi:MAG TPA: WG repeat-containing protein, partial [Cyclobacteriaceae bacterium]|nr:WG repeat-containing protein [Cyclobacteriaceae bacterium]HNC31754.1 WG repeat-containing protein [Cyclobacteriaceae bacterium]